MTHSPTTPANPAQGVTSDPIDKAVVEAINALRMEHTGRAYDILHDTLTAAKFAVKHVPSPKPGANPGGLNLIRQMRVAA